MAPVRAAVGGSNPALVLHQCYSVAQQGRWVHRLVTVC